MKERLSELVVYELQQGGILPLAILALKNSDRPSHPERRSRYFCDQRDRPHIDIDIKGIALLLPQINEKPYRASSPETVSRIGGGGFREIFREN